MKVRKNFLSTTFLALIQHLKPFERRNDYCDDERAEL